MIAFRLSVGFGLECCTYRFCRAMRTAGSYTNFIGTAFVLAVVIGAVADFAVDTAKMLFRFTSVFCYIHVIVHRYSPFPQGNPLQG